ncbi:MAG: rRNA pseudouridine synthase [Lachnospiraceae bacterium]|nr:rRNA pseudouridine synthase [Lachnospiraceae bacterium]
MRLNKRLVELGYCSRRNADKLIDEGRVKVNGKVAVLGEQVSETDDIEIDGEEIAKDDEKIILAYNKPRGIVCTESNVEKSEKISDKIKEFGFGKRLFTVGRLDKDSTGLILITNDGDFAKEVTNTHKDYEKEYEVRVNKPITGDFISRMQQGIYLDEIDKKTKPCKVHRFGKELYRFSITITQGLNRQVRRMCKALGYHVVDLKRTRIMKYKLGNLKSGEFKVIKKSDIF